jgi:O-antigen biosynthesis protein
VRPARRRSALIRLLRSLSSGFRRYLLLVRTGGLVRATERGVRFLWRSDTGSLLDVISERALDPFNSSTLAPATLKVSSIDVDRERRIALDDAFDGRGGSVCFVVRVTSDNYLAIERTVRSILCQTEPSWEILLSLDPGLGPICDMWPGVDERVQLLLGPIDGRNDLLRAALQTSSRFVGAVAQGDLIEVDLVAAICREVRLHQDADVIYTDEARILENSQTGDPFFKPDWSPDHLQSANYLGRFVALRTSLLLETVVAPITSIEASDYAVLLEVTRRAGRIIHIDEVLYLRAEDRDRSIGGFFSDAATVEARQVLQDHVRRENPLAAVNDGLVAGSLHVRWPIPPETAVTLVILTGMHRRQVPGRGNIVLVTHFVQSIIESSTFHGYRILVVDDGEIPDELRALLSRHGHAHCTYRGKGPFSFARKANFGVSLVEDGVVILLNDDMEVIDPAWIQELAGLALRPNIGVAGARLLHIDNTIQHAGVIIGFHGDAGHIFHHAVASGGEYGGFASIVRNFSAVTGAAMAFRKSVFDELGGLDEQFGIDYNDVDFCLRLASAGYRIAVTPAASLYHFHNSSLKRTRAKQNERRAFVTRWSREIERDPYFNKHFQKRNHDLSLLLSDAEKLMTLRFDCDHACAGSEETYRRLVAHIERQAEIDGAKQNGSDYKPADAGRAAWRRRGPRVIDILRSGLFDAGFYTSTYRDVADMAMDPILHYIESGDEEGRWPNAFFDPTFYRKQFAAVGRWPFSTLHHYVAVGEVAGLQPSAVFEPNHYLNCNAQLGPWIERPLAHFLWIGRHHGFSPARRDRRSYVN